MSIAEQIKSATEKILFTEEVGTWGEGTNELYEILSVKAGVYAEDLTHESYGDAKNGKFVSQITAAHCLKDIARSARFIRGLYQAITDQLKTKDSVHVLYAGCGPYATLFTPLTYFFDSNQVKATMLEIGQVPMANAQKVYDQLELTDYVKAWVNADGTDPQIQFDEKFDIIISETMQVALKKECQVPLTRNLVRFLKEDGTFVPQNIKVEATLEHPKVAGQPDELVIGSIYELDYKNVPEKNHETELTIPSNDYQMLMMKTSIQTYEDEWLKVNESGLTTKLILDNLVVPRKKAKLTYQEDKPKGEDIGFEIEYVD
ncbi:MAG: hypothetical protein R8G66_17120 [Cytophagales bacterium]|nr:hypothetical protein [Cytophagales bacterium]